MGWLSGWDKRIEITISNTNVDSELSDFPVSVYLSASSGTGNNDVSAVFDELTSDANRKKIAVTSSDGTTELYVEIERWDDANEKAWLWVKVPTVSNSAGTVLYFYFDAGHADNTSYVGDTGDTPAESVWDANFKGVWHMAQDPNGDAANAIKDSTNNDNDGTPHGGMTSADLVDGKVGKGIDFDGGNDYITTPAITLDNMTIEGIVKPDVLSAYKVIISNGLGGYPYLLLRFNSSGTNAYFSLKDNEGDEVGSVFAHGCSTGNYYYIVLVVDGTTCKVYIDLVEKGTDTDASFGSCSLTGNFYIGEDNRLGIDSSPFDGILDEIRISNIVRSAAWIKATRYSNWDDLAAFGNMEYGLSVASGTYALTGQDVTLIYTAGYTLSAEGGSYALTGQDVTLTAGYELVAEGGSYSLSGTAVSWKRSYVLAGGAGAYSLTGTIAALLKNYPMPAGAGNYTLVGASAELAILIAVINLASPAALEIELDSELTTEIELSSPIADEISLDSYLIK